MGAIGAAGAALAQEEGEEQQDAAEAQDAPEAPPGPPPNEPDAQLDGDAYQVSSIELQYAGFAVDRADLPALSVVRSTTIQLLRVDTGYVAPREGQPGEAVTLDELFASGPVALYRSAILRIGRTIAVEVGRRGGVIGVYSGPAPDQISADGTDLRGGQTALTFHVRVGSVAEVRTIASGDRVEFEDRVSSDKHIRLRRNSPVQAGDAEAGDVSFIRPRALEDYLHRLNRHPGRRVELAVGPGAGRDEAILDLLVYENRPWRVYGQVSNTGTEATNEWRQRFGFTHTQLTGRDDIFSIEYATAGFDDTHAVIGSYDTPIGFGDRLRFRVTGSWSEFTASDVGDNNQTFTGESAEVSGELVYNVLQASDLFIDASAGIRYFQTEVDNETAGIAGDESFFVPYVGLSAQRYRDTSTFDAALTLEWSMPGVTGVDSSELAALGRLEPDRSWQVLRAGVGYSLYLEPLFNADYETGRTPLAHELAFSVRGQLSFDNRLIPVEQQVAGGFFSVRGYEESIAAGDDVVIGSAEYRFHFPRALEPGRPRRGILGEQFRVRPASPGERPDWDLIGRVFFDAARVVNSDRQSAFEFDETLLGTGVGLELLVKRNLSVRADWGIALRDMDSGDVSAGSNRFHFIATIAY